jgi:hypothetical protein
MQREGSYRFGKIEFCNGSAFAGSSPNGRPVLNSPAVPIYR